MTLYTLIPTDVASVDFPSLQTLINSIQDGDEIFLSSTDELGVLKSFNLGLNWSEDDPNWDMQILAPHPGSVGGIVSLKMLFQFLDMGIPAHAAKYKTISVYKAIKIYGDINTTIRCGNEKNDIDFYNAPVFMCHNSKIPTFENLKFIDGKWSCAIQTYGPPVNLKNITIDGYNAAFQFYTDDYLAYPNLSNLTKKFDIINHINIENCKIINCMQYFHTFGGSIKVKNSHFGKPVSPAEGYWAWNLIGRVCGKDVGAFVFPYSPDYLGTLYTQYIVGDEFKNNTVDHTNKEVSVGNLFSYYGNWNDQGVIKNLNFQKNIFTNIYNKPELDIGWQCVLGIFGECLSEPLSGLRVSKNIFDTCNMCMVLESWGTGMDYTTAPLKGALTTQNEFIDCYDPDDGRYFPAISLQSWDVDAEIKECIFASNDFSNSGFIENDVSIFGVLADNAESIHHITGREFNLPNSSTDIAAFIDYPLDQNIEPFFNDFQAGRMCGNMKQEIKDKIIAARQHPRFLKQKHGLRRGCLP